jgi:biotin transport system ATP-binding protein
MRHFLGLSQPHSGELYYRGKDLRKNLVEARRALGFVFEQAEAQIIGQSVWEDVGFGPANLRLKPGLVKEKSQEALRAVGLEWAKDRQTDSLSGGELRRLAIAGILAMDADCLILDEPFANLDAVSVREVVNCLISLRESGKTIVVLTHELEKILAEANRLLVLDGGKVFFEGRPKDFPEPDYERAGLMNPFKTYRSVKDLSWR